jgi:phage protein D
MKNIQTINKLIARELTLKEDIVESVNEFYWKEVRRKLSSLESTSVSIKHLGTITTSKRKIDQFIKTTIKKIRNISKSNRYKESTKALLLDVNYDKLRKALVQRNELATQYYEAYIKRTERVRSTNANDIQECRQDIGSDNKSGEAGNGDAS